MAPGQLPAFLGRYLGGDKTPNILFFMYGEVGFELLGLACYGSGSGVLIAPAPPPTVRSDSYEVHKSHGLGSIIYFFIPQKAVGNSEMTMFNDNFNSPVEPRVRRRREKTHGPRLQGARARARAPSTRPWRNLNPGDARLRRL